MNWRWLLVIPIAYGAWNYAHTRAVSHPPGELVVGEPIQTSIEGLPSIAQRSGYRITPLESFSIEARVLSVEQYRFGREADVSPVDLALGWGPMSDQTVLDRMQISQGSRFYHWHVDEFPIPRREIETHSANMHMIPSTADVEGRLKSLHAGQVVKLSGYLVEVSASDGWRWRSSLTRDDTGAGACELVWVEAVQVN